MMTARQLKIFVLEALVLLLASLAIITVGYLLSRTRENERVQDQYVEDFYSVMPAESYSELSTSIIKSYPDINNVYLGYDAENKLVGYVIDITSADDTGRQLHFLLGIDSETASVTGISHISDEENPLELTDVKYSLIENKLLGTSIPIALSENMDAGVEEDEGEEETESDTNLRNGTYYAQSLTADDDGYIDFVEMEITGGIITKVQWDAFNLDKTTKIRSVSSLSGAYTVSGLDWATQSYNICHALLECQDPDELAMKSDGTTQIVDGVTCNIRPFVTLAKECLDNAREGFNKDKYYAGLDEILMHLFSSDAETLGIVRDGEYVVYSFDEYPSVYTVCKTDENGDKVAVKYLSVREIIAKYELDAADAEAGSDTEGEGEIESSEVLTPTATPTPYPTVDPGDVDGGEDGVAEDEGSQVVTDSFDSLPLSEISSYLTAPPTVYPQMRVAVKSVNTCYKFLKDYLNWLV